MGLVWGGALLYSYILVGFFFGRRFSIDTRRLSRLLFYGLSPIVIFCGVLELPLSPVVVLLPMGVWGISSLACGFTYWLAGYWWSDETRNLLAYSAGTGNSGYFGLPVAFALFDEVTAGVFLLAILGQSLYENSVGFYVASRGTHSSMESVKKVLSLPTLHAAIAALFLSWLGWDLPSTAEAPRQVAVLLYSAAGMMLIGIALSPAKSFSTDRNFLKLAFAGRWIIWPTVAFIAFGAVSPLLGELEGSLRSCLVLLSVVPVAANTVVFATLFGAPVQRMASVVLISTVIAMLYVPLVMVLIR